jgi:hypothetical protein
MILRLKYLFYFLIELIKTNPVKTLLVIIGIVAFNFAGTFPNWNKETKIEKIVQVDSGWVYLYQKIEENKIKYEMIYSSEKLDLKSNIYVSSEYHGANAFFWVLSVVSFFIVIGGTFDSNNDWEFSEVRGHTIGRLTNCEFEDGYYYYIIGGRLIGKTNRQSTSYRYIYRNFNIHSLNDVSICPKFETKTSRRESKLSKLGIC